MIGSTSTPTTSPSSGAASATFASLSPTSIASSLPEENEASDTPTKLSPRSTLQSTPSLVPRNAFATSTNDAAGGDNDSGSSNQVPVNRNLLESMMGLRGAKDNKTTFSFYRMMVGSMLAYVVLGIWIWTVVMFIAFIGVHDCDLAYEGLGEKLMESAVMERLQSFSSFNFENALATASCLETFTGSLACAHSITFGLISAVVIHETGSTDESAKDRLSSMINPLKKRQDINANFIQRTFCSLITSLPAVYVIGWTVFGLVCFIYSLMKPDGSASQTWIGLVVKATYSFFGVQEADESNSATSQAHLSQQQRIRDEV